MGREARLNAAKAADRPASCSANVSKLDEGDLDATTGLPAGAGTFPEVEGFVPFVLRENKDRTPAPSSIVVSYAHGAMVHEPFARSLAKMTRADRNVVGIDHMSSCNLPLNRNVLIHRFLEGEGSGTKADWMLFLDTDISFPPFTASAMLRVAQDTGADFVVVPYLLTNGCSTNARKLASGGYYTQGSFFLDRAYLVDAAGTGCMLMGRPILERMRDHYREQFGPWEFCGYDRIVRDGRPDYESEDYSLCRRAQEIGARLVSYTGIVLGHAKGELLAFKGTEDMVSR